MSLQGGISGSLWSHLCLVLLPDVRFVLVLPEPCTAWASMRDVARGTLNWGYRATNAGPRPWP